jgi:hypothetical protein
MMPRPPVRAATSDLQRVFSSRPGRWGDRHRRARGEPDEQAQCGSGGRANSVERDSENGATWEVEVTREDGTTVDVRLDAHYGLAVVEGDGEAR